MVFADPVFLAWYLLTLVVPIAATVHELLVGINHDEAAFVPMCFILGVSSALSCLYHQSMIAIIEADSNLLLWRYAFSHPLTFNARLRLQYSGWLPLSYHALGLRWVLSHLPRVAPNNLQVSVATGSPTHDIHLLIFTKFVLMPCRGSCPRSRLGCRVWNIRDLRYWLTSLPSQVHGTRGGLLVAEPPSKIEGKQRKFFVPHQSFTVITTFQVPGGVPKVLAWSCGYLDLKLQSPYADRLI